MEPGTIGFSTLNNRSGIVVENVDYAVVPSKHVGIDPGVFGLTNPEKYKEFLIPQGVDIPEPEEVFTISGISLCTKESISLLIAKAKAGKTTVAAWIAAQAIKLNKQVLWVDTEQGQYYGARTQKWILGIAGYDQSKDLHYLDVRMIRPEERFEIIENAISFGSYDLVVIDGVKDLVYDLNSPEEASLITNRLMSLSSVFKLHILSILHQNKGNDNARGHLGTELVNKSETVMKVTQNEVRQIVIEPEFTRGEPFEKFALERNDNGIPFLAEMSFADTSTNIKSNKIGSGEDYTSNLHLGVLLSIFKDKDALNSGDFLKCLREEWEKQNGIGMKENKAKEFRRYYLQTGFIIELTRQRGNQTINQLSEQYRVS